MKNGLKLTALLSLLIILQSCGFHLRGNTSTNASLEQQLNPLLLKGISRQSDFYDVALRRLRDSKINISTDKKTAQATLNITKYRFKRHILTVDRNNKAAEYEIRLELNFYFQHVDQTAFENHLLITRTYLSSGTDILGKEFERRDIRKAMYEDAMNQILNRIAAKIADE